MNTLTLDTKEPCAMNMTRRSFLKGLLALSATPLVVRLPAWDESPVSAEDPLAWLYLGETKFALADWEVEQYGAQPPDTRDAIPYPAPNWRWSAECVVTGDAIARMEEIAGATGLVTMRIVPPRFPNSFVGNVRAMRSAHTRIDRRTPASALLLFGSGLLRVEEERAV